MADRIGELAHALTGLIAGNCCHRTGGYDASLRGKCDCRDIAEGMLDESDRFVALLPAAAARPGPTHDLRQAVRDYISECDNPVPDYSHRRVLRDHLRELAGAPRPVNLKSVKD